MTTKTMTVRAIERSGIGMASGGSNHLRFIVSPNKTCQC